MWRPQCVDATQDRSLLAGRSTAKSCSRMSILKAADVSGSPTCRELGPQGAGIISNRLIFPLLDLPVSKSLQLLQQLTAHVDN